MLVPATPWHVFAVLTDAQSWPAWYWGVTRAVWLSPPPHGVGSERQVHLGPLRTREHYLVWEPGVRLAFAITAANLPGLRAMVEDFHLAGSAAGPTRVRYRMAFALADPMRPFGGIAQRLAGRIVRQSLRGLRRYVAQAPRGTRTGQG